MQTHGLQKLDQSNNIIKIFMSLGHILSHTGFSVVQSSKISLEIGCFFPEKENKLTLSNCMSRGILKILDNWMRIMKHL